MIELSARNVVELFEKKWFFKIAQLERVAFFYPGMFYSSQNELLTFLSNKS